MWESFAGDAPALEPLPGEALVARYPERKAAVVLTTHRLMVKDSAAVRVYGLGEIRDVRLDKVRNPLALVVAGFCFGFLAIGYAAYRLTDNGYLVLFGLLIGPFVLLGGLLALAGYESRAFVVETAEGKDAWDARKVSPHDLDQLRSRLKPA